MLKNAASETGVFVLYVRDDVLFFGDAPFKPCGILLLSCIASADLVSLDHASTKQ